MEYIFTRTPMNQNITTFDIYPDYQSSCGDEGYHNFRCMQDPFFFSIPVQGCKCINEYLTHKKKFKKIKI